MQSTDVDVIVIGAGPAGENVAGRVVRGGLSCAVVEEHLAGGECSYYACIPSKALLRPMELAAEVRRVPGLELGPVDPAAVLARRDEAVSGLNDGGQVDWIEKLPATLLRGRGRLAGPRLVDVTALDGTVTRLRARHAVVLATGSVPVLPPVPGLAEARPWLSRDATTVRRVPARLAVLGGGVVACEMGQALHALGARETTLLVRGSGLLGRMEPFAGDLLADSMRAAGIDVRLGAEVTRVERDAGPVVVHLADGSAIEADELLVATGRRPAVDDLGLDAVGLADGGPVRVDDSMRVPGVDWLYAVGDLNGRNLLTHMGKYQARVCGDVVVARAKGRPDDLPALRDTADGRGAPQVVFTDPQVCAVGRTEHAARADGFDVRTVEYDLGRVSGAYLRGDGYTGRAKAVIDERRRVLLGVTFAGPAVAELLHAATVAVTAEVPLDTLWHAVPAFPTVSEIWLRLLEEYGL
ncbi:NAD(P)/FAD-dependent oxidoreductase [Microtetraspora sp. AC03309]|uniref:dihydrolipoyl dehydrogenase family protein n=1 Tax=Microtetraspora sp. AC03309 TaxID=2779376 RepID=UPI001E55B1DE|nr:NAD(P)/FAD-dependent oxidoreductase [Microtetraspora sp. AC03309]MCC5576313.1 NAD(P)/FAD-dependent oxidoreductase [Microtetraspora sp. AC03309]